MSLFKDIFGTLFDRFQLNRGLGVLLKDNSGNLHVRDANDANFSRASGAAPINDEDFVTKGFLAASRSFLIVTGQVDGSAAIPTNTGTATYNVVTTAGVNGALGDVYRDDGSGTGDQTLLPADDGRTIFTTVALSGGTQVFDGDSIYSWNDPGGNWIKSGDIGSLSGGGRYIRYALNNSASQDSAFSILSGQRVFRVMLSVDTAYSAGAEISIGNTATGDLLMPITKNNPQLVGSYDMDMLDVVWPIDSVVRTTVTNTPAAGAGSVIVMFASPNA